MSSSRSRLEQSLVALRQRVVRYSVLDTPLGKVLLARSEIGLVAVEYLRAGPRSSSLFGELNVELIRDDAALAPLARELGGYLHGHTGLPEWPMDLRFVKSAFQLSVLNATQAIPHGAVVSYKRLAREVGRPEAVRAVAQALRRNPLAIAIPCHRVVGVAGELTGYAGGKTRLKQQLLSLEGVPTVRKKGDFAVDPEGMYVLMPGDREYCVPSCPAPEVLHSGIPTLFGSRQQAEAAGFAPCTDCRPDLHPLGGTSSR